MTRGVVVPLRRELERSTPVPAPVPDRDHVAASLSRALYVTQRTLDDGLPAEEVGAWYARRDAAARQLLTHLDPQVVAGEEFDTRLGRMLMWLEHGTRRRPEQITVYARTLCVPHIGTP